MPSTEDYIVWSELFAREYDANRQLFIEVAGVVCRWPRDNLPGMSADPNLANADHYWLGRMIGFMAQSPSQLAIYLDQISPVFGRIISDYLAIFAVGIGSVPWIHVCGFWHILKCATELLGLQPPGGGPPASAADPAQVVWGVAGYGHAMIFDLPFNRDARPWFRISEREEMIRMPPLPR